MLETLYGKTFFIVGTQLTVTWLTTVLLIGVARMLYSRNSSLVEGALDDMGRVDLSLDDSVARRIYWPTFFASIGTFLAMFFVGPANTATCMVLFTIWSVLTGITLALVLLKVNERLGTRVLGITAMIVIAAWLGGTQSGYDFSTLETKLAFGLAALLLISFARIFFSMGSWILSLVAMGGILLFSGYLLFDFYRLSQLNKVAEANNWTTAMQLAVNIYLDILNLFLQLLDLLTQASQS